eukprot:m.91778 g.91778  ORF g.91778 m.91778 type:complete len:111 (+) comp12338_c1_seq11:735-1067(+)
MSITLSLTQIVNMLNKRTTTYNSINVSANNNVKHNNVMLWTTNHIHILPMTPGEKEEEGEKQHCPESLWRSFFQTLTGGFHLLQLSSSSTCSTDLRRNHFSRRQKSTNKK